MVSDWQGYLCGDMKIYFYIVALVILVVDIILPLLLVLQL
jgi:hypothetical protein